MGLHSSSCRDFPSGGMFGFNKSIFHHPEGTMRQISKFTISRPYLPTGASFHTVNLLIEEINRPKKWLTPRKWLLVAVRPPLSGCMSGYWVTSTLFFGRGREGRARILWSRFGVVVAAERDEDAVAAEAAATGSTCWSGSKAEDSGRAIAPHV